MDVRALKQQLSESEGLAMRYPVMPFAFVPTWPSQRHYGLASMSHLQRGKMVENRPHMHSNLPFSSHPPPVSLS